MATETCYGLAQIVNECELELERYVDSFDTILPFFRVRLTGEHLAAWAVHGLLAAGCRCRRLCGSSAGAKRVTRKDQGMVYYSTDALSATLIRGGAERTQSFAFETKESEADFISFIVGLLRDGAVV